MTEKFSGPAHEVGRKAIMAAARAAREICVGVPSPSGHDIVTIKVSKRAFIDFLNSPACAADEFDPEGVNCGGTFVMYRNGVLYWN